VVARVLGIPKASLGNWVRAEAKGELSGVTGDDKVVKVAGAAAPGVNAMTLKSPAGCEAAPIFRVRIRIRVRCSNP